MSSTSLMFIYSCILAIKTPIMTSSSSFCWGCGVKCSMRCGRCKNAFYCSQDCISSSWAFHRSHCHKEFGTLLNTLYSKNMCEVYYDDIKGYGLRAICDMPAMTQFAVFHSPAMGIVETHLSGQHDYSIAVPNIKKRTVSSRGCVF